jgi:hypothetical protein
MNNHKQSLIPYNEDYVLIHKKSLVVNTGTMSAALDILSQFMSVPVEDVAEIIREQVVDFAHNLSDEEINSLVLDLIAKSRVNQINQQPYSTVTLKRKK